MRVRASWCGLALALVGCKEQKVEPAGPNPFVETFEFLNSESKAPVGQVVSFAVNTGFTAELTFVASPNAPAALEQRVVQPPSQWPLTVVFFPRGSDRASKHAIYGCGNRVRRPNERVAVPMLPYEGVDSSWKLMGYRGPPKPPKSWPADEYRFWTFFAVPLDEPGEYVFEVLLFPTSVWKSSVRVDPGPAVVLQRGLLLVTADDT